MGPTSWLSKLTKLTTYGGATVVGSFFILTRDSMIEPLPTSDPLFHSAIFRENNPENNATTRNVCIRRVSLQKINPRLLENEFKLVEAFGAGVFGGYGYALQRAFVARKYKNTQTAQQLWSSEDLRTSKYSLGTQITDQFEVIDRTNNRIVLRCGDSPLKIGVRAHDGFFELTVSVNPKEGNAVFQMKCIFFQGLGKSKGPLMPLPMEWLHRQYTKLLMESGIQNVMR